MSEYTIAAGPEFVPRTAPVVAPEADLEERLRRAELFMRLPSLVSYEQPMDEILATLARSIVENTRAVAAGVSLVSATDTSTIALGYHNLPPGYLEGMQLARQTSEQGEILRRRAQRGETWVLRQAPQYMLSRPEYAHMHDLLRQVPFDTLIGTPFMDRPDAMGFVFLYYGADVEVDDSEVAFARALAEYARPLMDNAWLFTRLDKRTAELEALYRADAALHRSLDIDDVEQSMVDLAVELLGASSSLVVTWDDADRLAVRACRGMSDEARAQMNARYQKRTRASFEGRDVQPILLEDVFGYAKIEPVEFRQAGPRSLAELPVKLGDELWGFFSIGWTERRTFSADDSKLFDAFIARASLAIQNAVLFAQGQLAASNEERQRLARDLHDSVSQALYGISLGARTARARLGDSGDPAIVEPVEYIAQLAESGLAETRALIFELIPESLENEGLVVALQRQAAAIQARSQVEVAAELESEPELPIRVKEALYRIAQESLHNMAKHAQARKAVVSLTVNAAGGVLLRIRDDGQGFDTAGEFPGHFGLQSMAERARRMGGEYTIESSPGAGTTVTVAVPGQP